MFPTSYMLFSDSIQVAHDNTSKTLDEIINKNHYTKPQTVQQVSKFLRQKS